MIAISNRIANLLSLRDRITQYTVKRIQVLRLDEIESGSIKALEQADHVAVMDHAVFL
jgi:hypothetical protein